MKILTLIFDSSLFLTLELNLSHLNAFLISLLFEIHNEKTFYIIFHLNVRKLFKRNLNSFLFLNDVVAFNLKSYDKLSTSIVLHSRRFRLVLALLLR